MLKTKSRGCYGVLDTRGLCRKGDEIGKIVAEYLLAGNDIIKHKSRAKMQTSKKPKLEDALEYLINGNEEKAKETFKVYVMATAKEEYKKMHGRAW